MTTSARIFFRRLQLRWGWKLFSSLIQGSVATLGWRLESLWDSGKDFTPSKTWRSIVAAARQSAALFTNVSHRCFTKRRYAVLALLLSTIIAQLSTAFAQSYSIDWHKVAGGGGTSTNSQFAVSGTSGQPDASGAMTSGQYSVSGGYWSLISVVQTPGAPTLYISHAGNVVTVYWQNISGWNLIQNNDLTTPVASWSSSSSPTLTGGTNYLNIVNPTGNLFFRLKNP